MKVVLPVEVLGLTCLTCPKLNVTTEEYVIGDGIQKVHCCSNLIKCKEEKANGNR